MQVYFAGNLPILVDEGRGKLFPTAMGLWYIYIRTYVHTYVHKYICVYVHTCTYVYVYVFMCT
jgi:hypothetical protein